ncbi:preprotein translocase subunit SecA [Candidatus Chloroploca asiatica]|uniref:Protein translocase subunit SecA n=1 Tax=Candidatus Chloroploca asiatica TaxID=1506545 RepID=A0A2H3L5B8_9CHLR|nr:preprotein translocase subunit SecA [Candidatus Chloroploca asiatica]PDV98394.1 preprotein translocase subunit SecA [Candidatus Chloroploca asiatica]
MFKWLKKLVGDTNDKAIRELQPLVEEINELEPEYQALSDEALAGKTAAFKARLAEGETLDEILPEAFATVREAARRTIGLRHYDVQLIGGIVLHDGKIAEMKTGEGKTLVATLPLYLNAIEGKGSHLVTVNDYLARVGAGWMGPIYHFLGLKVGFIAHDQSAIFDPTYVDPNANAEDTRLIHWRPVPRREAYAADITYGTNNEFGFDFLRDNMAYEKEQMVQRELHFAIVDEVDNILIDEARTPLIISGPAQKSSDLYRQMTSVVKNLRRSSVTPKQIKEEGMEPDGDFFIEERTKSITLTEQGIENVERLLKIPDGESLYDPLHFEKTHFVENALKAQFVFQRDRDYMVTSEGEVVIIDEFTGRSMPGRRWSDGLHQAVEAKEGVLVKNENVTLATITFQNYFRMYGKLAGMTGTAYTEREEFAKIYNLEVVIIPTNRSSVRDDLPDQIYRSEAAKFNAVVSQVAELNELGRPVLIGTTSVETSEKVSELLKRRGIDHSVLNAKFHAKEATIVAQAGRKGSVTVATNMAGRGTDILLGGNPDGLVEELLAAQGITFEEATPEQVQVATEEAKRLTATEGDQVRELGGLHIIGTERHEARRIDNQLRGRAGRQGDPGSSRFFLSLEDELMRRFGPVDRIKGLMNRFLDEDLPLEAGLLDRTIESAQTRVEGYNFDLRKHTVEFDDVMNKQRQIIYQDRRDILDGKDVRDQILQMIGEEIAALVDEHLPDEGPASWDLESLLRQYRQINPTLPEAITPATLSTKSRDEIEIWLVEQLEAAYEEREQAMGAETIRFVERRMMLGTIDRQWIDYLTAMDELRQNIMLQAFAQRDPLIEFRKQSFAMFDQLKDNITRDIVYQIIAQSFAYERYLRQLELEQKNRLATARAAGGSSEMQNLAAKPQRKLTNIGRNERCPCGSGKKFKHCHEGREEELVHLIAAQSQGAEPVHAAVAQASQPQAVPAGAQAEVRRGRQVPSSVPRGKKR